MGARRERTVSRYLHKAYWVESWWSMCHAVHLLALLCGYGLLALLALAMFSQGLTALGVQLPVPAEPPPRLSTADECHTLVVR